ncbi:CpsD/CapB family tyrosine-protein kinase, partial [Kitasatospora sp. LaBMicrA B282]|uniref:CpsD/CapB family tyrosine-protein kinase n=1 Tax=Kitasatospora sp. LaBMicrA B282 TaxID=3420949 RepID=UPI003D0AE8C4
MDGAEAVGQLRTALRYAAEPPPTAVVLTSAQAGEGRTTTAVDLALSHAQAGRRVVLVEGDLRAPRLAEYLGLTPQPGLTELLTGAATVEQAVQDWGEGLLQVVTAGLPPGEPGDLLAGADLTGVLRALAERADLVLLDSPPLLAYPDAALLAAEAGSALLVLRSGATPRARARRALDALDAVDAQVLGVVLTAVPRKRADRAEHAVRRPAAPEPDHASRPDHANRSDRPNRPGPGRDRAHRPVPWPAGWRGAPVHPASAPVRPAAEAAGA